MTIAASHFKDYSVIEHSTLNRVYLRALYKIDTQSLNESLIKIRLAQPIFFRSLYKIEVICSRSDDVSHINIEHHFGIPSSNCFEIYHELCMRAKCLHCTGFIDIDSYNMYESNVKEAKKKEANQWTEHFCLRPQKQLHFSELSKIQTKLMNTTHWM